MTRLAGLSVVIPVLDRADALAETLSELPPVGEVIVVDGGSTDGSAEVAAGKGATVLRTSPGRGLQLSAGADRAPGPWLLFLHADTRLDAAAWSAIADHVRDSASPARAATFRLALDDGSWQARLVERGVRFRVALLALPYGDQGLLIHRSLYRQVGGFADLPLLEDVDLVRRLGRARLVRLPGDAITSAERWRRRGWLRQTATNLLCIALYLAGVPPRRIARLYER